MTNRTSRQHYMYNLLLCFGEVPTEIKSFSINNPTNPVIELRQDNHKGPGLMSISVSFIFSRVGKTSHENRLFQAIMAGVFNKHLGDIYHRSIDVLLGSLLLTRGKTKWQWDAHRVSLKGEINAGVTHCYLSFWSVLSSLADREMTNWLLLLHWEIICVCAGGSWGGWFLFRVR